MRSYFTQVLVLLTWITCSSQTFVRSELPTLLDTPWEMTYGPDGYLWITEKGGRVSKVDPVTGAKTVIYTCAGYYPGHSCETCTLCFQPKIGSGTFGLALHPDFMNPATPYLYFVHSYNSSADTIPNTKFRIERLTLNANRDAVISQTTLVNSLPNGYDHLGGRLMIIPQNSIPYLFLSVGDNGISEVNSPGCYTTNGDNPNNKAQNINYKNGKIHRFNLDGSIPSTNPVAGNSFYTRGHRNPQGLIFNPVMNVIYDVEHGDRTDDEINILEAGMNYGWKDVRGYHNDNNYPGEASYVAAYTPDPLVPNDALKEPLYSWCAATQFTNSNNMFWGTVAPSDGIYYGSSGIPDWTNSLLVVTLKNGNTTDQEVYRFKLNSDGKSLAPSTVSNPNPARFFAEDQQLNGRLRDIAVSPDGKKIFLINNGGAPTDKITVYTYDAPPSAISPSLSKDFKLDVFPVPASDYVTIDCSENVHTLSLYNLLGEEKSVLITNSGINVAGLPSGTYYLKIATESGNNLVKKLVKN
jgi:glucose/arabinose dehydrogenase